MKVKEIMTKKLVTISPDMLAKEALELLQEMQISGLPVIDGNKKLLGMFTEKEILVAILPSYLEKVGRFVYDDNPRSIKNKFRELADLPVSRVMRKNVITVDADTALCEVARLMLTQKVRRIPVLDKEKKVVGIVSREDVVKAYAMEAGWETD